MYFILCRLVVILHPKQILTQLAGGGMMIGNLGERRGFKV